MGAFGKNSGIVQRKQFLPAGVCSSLYVNMRYPKSSRQCVMQGKCL
jgi:hypothetical protein